MNRSKRPTRPGRIAWIVHGVEAIVRTVEHVNAVDDVAVLDRRDSQHDTPVVVVRIIVVLDYVADFHLGDDVMDAKVALSMCKCSMCLIWLCSRHVVVSLLIVESEEIQ